MWSINDKPADHLELGPNCPPEDVAPTCRQCEKYEDCFYANIAGTHRDDRST